MGWSPRNSVSFFGPKKGPKTGTWELKQHTTRNGPDFTWFYHQRCGDSKTFENTTTVCTVFEHIRTTNMGKHGFMSNNTRGLKPRSAKQKHFTSIYQRKRTHGPQKRPGKNGYRQSLTFKIPCWGSKKWFPQGISPAKARDGSFDLGQRGHFAWRELPILVEIPVKCRWRNNEKHVVV